jgi:predicted phosphoribosyltransferase
MIFKDRSDAGRQLASSLGRYRGNDTVVYALPRGGVVIGAEIAQALDIPLDLIIVRKVGHPFSPEYAIAAVAEDGHTVTNRSEVESIDEQWFQDRVHAEQQEANRRRQLYMRNRSPISAAGKIAIVVDDGLATGLTMFAAIQEVRHSQPFKVVVAVPVAPPDTVEKLKAIVDDVVVLYITPDFRAIGPFYLQFDQVTDAEVIQLMRSAQATT